MLVWTPKSSLEIPFKICILDEFESFNIHEENLWVCCPNNCVVSELVDKYFCESLKFSPCCEKVILLHIPNLNLRTKLRYKHSDCIVRWCACRRPWTSRNRFKHNLIDWGVVGTLLNKSVKLRILTDKNQLWIRVWQEIDGIYHTLNFNFSN